MVDLGSFFPGFHFVFLVFFVGGGSRVLSHGADFLFMFEKH